MTTSAVNKMAAAFVVLAMAQSVSAQDADSKDGEELQFKAEVSFRQLSSSRRLSLLRPMTMAQAVVM